MEGLPADVLPVKVAKTDTSKILVHLMPWFESKDFSGYWGIHWTMANKIPEKMDSTGRRQIASYYYPLIGPYSSADHDIIEYQLLLMKLSGVDGILIDWPGTLNANDYFKNRQNAEAFINMVDKVGLKFSVVYEDNNLNLGSAPDKIAAAKNDMIYLRDNYFNRPSFIYYKNAPLLLDFGPQAITTPTNWTTVFSVFTVKPFFLTLWYEHDDAGTNCKGEYSWVYQDATSHDIHLTNFYDLRVNYGLKMGSAYPGFNAFYKDGGWGTNPFVIPADSLSTFKQTLDLAISKKSDYIQIATWNDYGEGTMIEPTREFGYSFLTYLQQKLGVQYTQADLEMVNTLFMQRKRFKGSLIQQERLNKVFDFFITLKLDSAKNLLAEGSNCLPVDSVILSEDSISIPKGQLYKLNAFVKPDLACNHGVTWSSSVPAVASVGADGQIVSLSIGTAKIKVTTEEGSKVDSCIVNVTDAAIPGPWKVATIGSMTPTGVASFANEEFTVLGAGVDIWDNADAFCYTYQNKKGNFSITTKITSLTPTDPWAKAGVMIRETLDANSPHALTAITIANGLAFQNRETAGQISYHTAGPTDVVPYWIRLERVNGEFTGSCSKDNIHWFEIGKKKITMNDDVYVGMAVTSHNDGVSCAAIFKDVVVKDTIVVSAADHVNNFAIYPNPSSEGYFVVKSSKLYNSAFIEINDMNGRVLLRQALKDAFVTINTKGFANGIYFIKISNGGVWFSKLIIK